MALRRNRSETPLPPDFDIEEFQRAPSELRGLIERYEADEASLLRSLPFSFSPHGLSRLERFYREWRAALDSLEFEALSRDGRIDDRLFRNHLDYKLRGVELQARRMAEEAPFLPFAEAIFRLEESRRRMEPVEPERAAEQIDAMRLALETAQKSLEDSLLSEASSERPNRFLAFRASNRLKDLQAALKNWFTFYGSYDPLFSWWIEKPYGAVEEALNGYAAFLREKIVGLNPGDDRGIVGDPLGRDALMSDLAHEMIPYTPEELIEIAEREYAWCEAEMMKASCDLGCGDDWRVALELVKTRHQEPGRQPEMIRQLALEAIAFVEEHDLVSIPELARETWRMEMMSPEDQKVSPFFLGGEVIQISYPTDSMTHEQKRMSMRGNNVHFARATVYHELIPGHHLQLFMLPRSRSYRRLFDTPFWIEGWTLHWEMLFWDMDFAKSAENRVGMLFWRMHRCVRVRFSLGFHLGELSADECIEMLVQRVGHERENAVAEVRRSFGGSYPPLYQCAYLIGGLQVRALHREIVGAGKMTNRQFHDAFLKENSIPIAMVRASLTGETLTEDAALDWRFEPNSAVD